MTLSLDYSATMGSSRDLPPSELGRAVASEETPYQLLRATTPLAELKAKGTFFTSAEMAATLWENSLDTVRDGAIIVDPASGAGDLLLPVTGALRELGGTSVIRVNDIDARFTEIATNRLVDSLGSCSKVGVEPSNFDFLADQTSISNATHVVLNPPYINIKVSEPWASGQVNAAAVFVDVAAAAMEPGSLLLAVLPDVLRSGSRYEVWRQAVARHGRITEVRPLGQFDPATDVDVFKLALLVGAAGDDVPWVRSQPESVRINDLFEIRVGPVVPHRDPEAGPEVAYVTARSLSAGSELRRRFAGRLETGPFVLINRTSRPGERPRLRARIHLGQGPVAVENHLIVAKPRPGSNATCAQLLDVLASDATVEFLDDRIRCRHLTVRAVREIPWGA